MFRTLFLMLFLFSVSVYAQAQAKPTAYKFFEYGKISDNLLKEKLADYYKELKQGNSQGYVIDYGSDKDVKKRQKQMKNSDAFRGADAPKIEYVRGLSKNEAKTILWIVPKGALPPTPN